MKICEEHRPDKEVILAVAGATTNSKIDYEAFERGGGDMCTLFEEIARDSREEGMAKGIEKGRKEGREEGREEGIMEGRAKEIVELSLDFGLSEGAVLGKLQSKLNISQQRAQEYFEMFGKQTV